jgi:hypothetical protein
MTRSVRSPALRPALLAALLATLLVPVARAALVDRGGGMLYDTVLDVTWLADANFARTSGHDADGRMTLAAARDWVDNLAYGGFSDWRLPSTGKAGADWVRVFSYDGSTDIAYNITSPRSELSYMYYVNLGLAGEFNPDGTRRDDWGVFGNGTLNGTDGNSHGQRDIGPVHNLQAFIYWSGSTDGFGNGVAWTMHTSTGVQSRNGPNGLNHAWADQASMKGRRGASGAAQATVSARTASHASRPGR